MKKRILSILLAALLLFGILPGASAASGSLSNFTRIHTYQSGRFSDVASSHWYASYVQAAYEYGLVNGRTAKAFDPNGTLTAAEAVKLAVCLNSIYYTGSAPASNSLPNEPWYRPYADAALAAGILEAEHRAYNAPITRSEFALILSKALPDEALSAVNTVEDGAIPDVPMDLPYSVAVYKLYRAGVLTGSDAGGRFHPDTTIKRSEVAAVITRMADAAYRKSLTLKLSLTPSQIFDKCAPAVFYISIDDVRGKNVKSGSGFFISETGLAVTNYHVIVGAAAATVTTLDGKKHPVSGLYGYDEELDLALIQVEGTGFSCLELADSDSLAVGADVYAIGSPLGYQNTISAGIISGLGRQIDQMSYIQTTAAISSGSSGGALLNSSGKLIGVTTATAAGAQNINLAVPSNNILKVVKGDLITLVDALPGTRYYDDLFPAPDFGAFAGISTYKTEKAEDDTYTYYYRVSDLNKKMTTEEAYEGYARLLQQNTFSFYGYAIEEGQIYTYFINGAYNMLVTFGSKTVDGVDCIRIQIMSF